MAGTNLSASIGNRVWHDLNNNGKQDAGEPGMMGVPVKLLGRNSGSLTNDYLVLDEALTDSNGLFYFSNLAAGDYRLQFTTPAGYLSNSPNAFGVPNMLDSDAGALGMTGIFSLAAGEVNDTIDAGFFAPFVLGDTVWLDSNRNGMQDADEPGVSGVRVDLIGSYGTIGNTITDSEGHYQFEKWSPNVHSVRFTAPVGYAFTTANVGTDDSKDSDANSAGNTASYTLLSHENNASVDAGLIPVSSSIKATSDFANIKENTATVKASVFVNDAGLPLTVTAIRTGELASSGTSGTVGSALNGKYGALTINSNGSYSYALNNNHDDINRMGSADRRYETFVYTAKDAQSHTDSAQLSITISGVDDTLMANNDAATMKRADMSVSFNVLTNDVSSDSSALTVTAIRAGAETGTGHAGVVGANLTGTYGILNLQSYGSYVYTLNRDNVSVKNLDVSKMLNDTFTYTSSNNHGELDTAQLVITITGENTPPGALVDIQTIIENTESVSANVLSNDIDLDGQSLSVTAIRTGQDASMGTVGVVGRALAGAFGTVTVNSDGSYRYVLNNDHPVVNSLKSGSSVQDVFTYTNNDGSGGADQSLLVVTIRGENDVPVLAGDSATMDRAYTSVSANVLANDRDPEGDVMVVTGIRTGDKFWLNGTAGTIGSALNGAYGSLTLQANGDYRYVLDRKNTAVKNLMLGQKLNDVFTYAAEDGIGGTASSQLFIEIQGGDAKISAADDTVGIQEHQASVFASVLSNDRDPEGDLFVSAIRTGLETGTGNIGALGTDLLGTYGKLNLKTDGNYIYTLNQHNSVLHALNVEQSVTETFTYTARDGLGRSDQAHLSIRIAGENDVPTLAAIGTVNYIDTAANDSFAASNGSLVGTDVDAGSMLFYGIQGQDYGGTQHSVGHYGTLSLTSATGAWVYTPNAVAMNGMAKGTVQDSFNVYVGDGTARATQVLTVNVTAANDLPELSKPNTVSYTENAIAVPLATGLNISDRDDTLISSARIAISSGLTAGDVLSVDLHSNDWTLGTSSEFINAANRIDIAYDTRHGVLYISGDDSVRRYDFHSHSFLSPIKLGGRTLGMDISPDGKTLAVANATHTDKQSYFDLINLDTGTSSRVNFDRGYMDGGTFSVAYDQQSKLLISSSFEGSGWVPLRKYDPVSHAISSLGDVTQDSMLTASADRRVIGIEESNISTGPWGVYHVGDTAYRSQHDGYEPITGGTSAFNYEIGVSRDGSQLAIPTYLGTFIGSAQEASKVVGTYASEAPIGVAYSPTTDVVFFPFADTDYISVYDTKTLTEAGRITVPGHFEWTGGSAYVEGRTKVANDSSYLFSTVDNGISISSLNNIKGQYDSSTGVLSLTGSASLSAYQAVLRSIGYSSTSDDPTASATSRTISWSVTDAHSGQSSTQNSVLNIEAVNDVPELNITNTSYSDTAAQDSFSPHTGTAIGSDIDNHAPLIYGLIEGVRANLTNVTGAYGNLAINPNTGVYTYTPSASAINALSGEAIDQFTVMVSDDLTNTNAHYTVTLMGVNDAPIAANDQVTTNANTAHTITVANLLGNDRDVDTGSSFSHIVINRLPVATSGALMLNGQAVTLNQTISLADLSASKLRFVPANNYVGNADFDYQASDASLLSNSATVSISVLSRDDYSSTLQTTGRVNVNGNQTGNIETAADTDWFNIQLDAGKTYHIDLQGATAQAGTLNDPFLRGVYNTQGVLLPNTSNDDFNGNNSRVTFVPGATGNYFISAGAYSTQTGSYRLSVTAADAPAANDDYTNNISTSGKVLVNGSQTGNIEAALDKDWFKVDLEAGKTYRINMEGIALSDTFIHGIYNKTGVAIANTRNDDFGADRNSQVTFTPGETGAYFIEAGAYSNLTGTYRVSVMVTTSSNTDDYSSTIETTGRIAVGQQKNGNIEIGSDTDWFKATLQAGHNYRINLEGAPTGVGTLPDTFLKGIFDSAGGVIANTSNDDSNGLNSQVLFTPTLGGDYHIAAGAYGNNTGTYKLSLTDLLDSASHMDQLLGRSNAVANTVVTTDYTNAIQELGQIARLLDQAGV